MERAVLMPRATSFYYAFLVLPAEERRAIIAVWDFCRAVDDAVDEDRNGQPSGRAAIEFWRSELAACFEGRNALDTRRAGSCGRSSRASLFHGRRSRT